VGAVGAGGAAAREGGAVGAREAPPACEAPGAEPAFLSF